VFSYYFVHSCAAHSSIVIKAENVADKIEMMNKIRNIIESRGGGPSKGPDGGLGKRSLSDGSLVSFPLQSKNKTKKKCLYVFFFCFEALYGCFISIVL
jgi:hypothetical protein